MKKYIPFFILILAASITQAQDFRIDTLGADEFQIVEIFDRDPYVVERKHPVTDSAATVDFFLTNAAQAYEVASAKIEQTNDKVITARAAERAIRDLTGVTWHEIQVNRILADSSFFGNYQMTFNDTTAVLKCTNGRVLRRDGSNYAVIIPKNENVIYLRFLADKRMILLFTRNGGRVWINQRTEDDNLILRKQ